MGGGLVHLKGEKGMALSGLHDRKVLVGTWRAHFWQKLT